MDSNLAWDIAEISFGGYKAGCLKAVYELGIHNILLEHNNFMSTDEIVAKVSGAQVNKFYLQRVMRFLACFGVFKEKLENNQIVFAAPETYSDQMVIIELFTSLEVSDKIGKLLKGCVDGKSLYKYCTGNNVWEAVEKNPFFARKFQQTMNNYSNSIKGSISKIAEEIKSRNKEESCLVDIGGMDGSLLTLILQELPNLKCINFDLQSVISRSGNVKNVEMVAGDMFVLETIPKCDMIIMKNVLHDWNDEDCEKILNNCHKSLAEDGLLLLVNLYLDSPKERESTGNWFNAAVDIQMLCMFDDAKERMFSEYENLLNSSNFVIEKIVDLGPMRKPSSLIIARKEKS